MVWTKSEIHVKDFMSELDQKYPSIKFDYKFDCKQIEFLDTLVYIDQQNKLQTTLFRKSSDRQTFLTILTGKKAWCKSETRTPGPGTRDPRPPSKFKSETPGPPSKFQSGTPGPPSKFKSGTPSLSLNEFIFLRIFHRFFYLSIFASFLNKIYTKKYQLRVTEINSLH